VALSDRSALTGGEALALKIARLLRDASDDAPLIVLSDATAAASGRTRKAGRIEPCDGLSAAEWDWIAAGAERIARAVRDDLGLRTAIHHHCGTYVETPQEIDALLERTSADLVGLCLDTGHATYGGGDPVNLVSRYGDRIWHVHFKDCSPSIAERARLDEWDYRTAIRHGLFCELGQGQVDFTAVLAELRVIGYDGWIVVEQDVLPSMGTPAESAARNRAFLRQIGV
jgi:inosose dehydratase